MAGHSSISLFVKFLYLGLFISEFVRFSALSEEQAVGPSINLVRIFAEDNNTAYNITSCENTTHDKWGYISVEALNCVNLYQEKGCEGKFVRWQPNEFTRLVENEAHSWFGRLIVRSVGPCFDRCDARNWDNSDMIDKVDVFLYEEQDFTGMSANILVKGSECSLIPAELDGIRSIKIFGDYKNCIELHSSSECTNDRYVILRPYYPKLNSLIHHGMHGSAKIGTYSVKAVSLCGKFCNATKSATNHSTSNAIGIKDAFTYMEDNEHDDISIRFGESSDSEKGRTSFNVTGCVTLPPYMYKSLHWIVSNSKNCVNVYSKSNCRGEVVRWKPSPDEEYNSNSIFWNEKLMFSQVKSFGPCTDKCDPKYWEGFNGTEAVDVTLFNGSYFSGSKIDLAVNPGECLLLPLSFKIRSIQFKDNTSCIELHRSPHCGDTSYALLRPGYPNLSRLLRHGQHDETSTSVTENSRAISLCGSFCEKRKQMKAVNDPPKENPGKGIVTVFDYVGYYGNPTHHDLSKGCVTLKGDGLTDVGSLWTYGQCVVVYGTRDCKQEGVFTEILQIYGKPVNYYLEKLTSHTFPIVGKSIRLCNETELAEESKVEQDEKHTDPHKCDAVDLKSDRNDLISSIPTYMFRYGFFIVIINTAVFSLFGAFIHFWFMRYTLRENSNVYVVFYNSEKTETTNNSKKP